MVFLNDLKINSLAFVVVKTCATVLCIKDIFTFESKTKD
jgi:hypothetical protein